MAIDKRLFPMNMLVLEGKKVLVWPEADESSNLTNVVIGEPRNKVERSDASRKVELHCDPYGKEVMTITILKPTPEGQTCSNS
jgi:hypothetical protein